MLFDESTTQDGYVEAVRLAVLGARLGIGATNQGTGKLELNGDDDDGVIMSAFNRNTVTEVIVTASAEGLLDAWIDFNIDGDFDDPGEQIFASRQLKAGQNTFEVRPPADTVDGQTVGRFRFSSIGGLRPTGLAPDGEVEDYVVQHPGGQSAGRPQRQLSRPTKTKPARPCWAACWPTTVSTPGGDLDGADVPEHDDAGRHGHR